MKILGYKITKDEVAKKSLERISSDEIDGSIETDSQPVEFAGRNQYFYDFEQELRLEKDQIQTYRDTAYLTDTDSAIDDIVNEIVVVEDNEDIVTIELEDTEFSSNVQDKIAEEFEFLLNLLEFNNDKGDQIFRQWYIDGKQYYHKVVNPKKLKEGIQELNWLDPVKTRKVKENTITKDVAGNELITGTKEFYIYDPSNKKKDKRVIGAYEKKEVLKLEPDSIAYTHSGIIDHKTGKIRSYLHKAVKPANQLAMLEDSLVVYRLTKSTERRIFYVDVGNLPKSSAEQYIKSLMNQYRNKMVYDVQTGTVKGSKVHMSMMEDIWLPRKEGGKGTEVSTLQGGQNLGEMDDVLYFRKKLYKALNIPESRLEQEASVNFGATSEISRDELKFSKFVDKLKRKFNHFFFDILKTQLLLKGIITEVDWNNNKYDIKFIYNRDSYFQEAKQTEIMALRLETLSAASEGVGKYYDVSWVRREILKMNEEEIKELDDGIEKDKKKYGDPYGDDQPEFDEGGENKPPPPATKGPPGNE